LPSLLVVREKYKDGAGPWAKTTQWRTRHCDSL